MSDRVTLDYTAEQLAAALTETFGFASFLPGQAEIIAAVLRGEDWLVVRPTGSGKSLCYQLPALCLPPLTVVVSPLIALMKDQVDTLEKQCPGSATFINSSIPIDEQRKRLGDAVEGRVKLLYVAPERFRFNGFLRRLADTRISRFVVDEAHCISEWGHDFRPDYLRLREVLGPLGEPPLLALTATATRDTQQDITKQLGRPEMPVVVSGFNRPNLSFEVRYAVNESMKWQQLETLLTELPEGSGIIYTATRKDAEAVAGFVRARTSRQVVAYHAGFEAEHRSATQELFMDADEAIAVATCAFGMGIDKPDVRFVVHFSLPGTVEAYYQQAGRGGRDGGEARCVLLYDPSDRSLQEWFIEHESCSGTLLQAVLDAAATGLSDAGAIARRCDCHELQVRSALRWLERAEALTDSGDYDGAARLEVLRPQLEAAELAGHDELLQRRQKLRRVQLDAIVRYAEMSTSRRGFLLSYFGDEDEPTAEEAARDDPALPAPEPAEVTPEETEAARRILQTVQGLGYGVGRQKIVQILKGSNSAQLRDQHRRLESFGSLATFRTEHLADAIDHLVCSGYLKPIGGDRPVLALTTQGKAALADERRLLAVPSLRTASPVTAALRPGKAEGLEGLQQRDLSSAEHELYDRLCAWRAATARKLARAPWLVFSNQTLRALTRLRPTDTRRLLQVPGIGPTKVEVYGGDVTALIEAWQVDLDNGVIETPDEPAEPAPVEPPPVPPAPDPTERAVPAVSDEATAVAERIAAGGTPDEAAAALGCSASQVGNHITTLLAAGRLQPEQVIEPAEVTRISELLAAHPDLSLSDAKAALGQGVSYLQIRWVREALQAGRTAAPAPAAEPAPEPTFERLAGPWDGGWAWRGEGEPDLAAAVALLAAATDPAELLLAPAHSTAEIDRFLRHLSRRWAVPVNFGLLSQAAAVERTLAGPLLVVAPRRHLAAAVEAAQAAGASPCYAIAVG